MHPKPISASVLNFVAPVAERLTELGIGVELSEFSIPENFYPDTLKTRMLDVYELLKDFKGGPISMHGAFYNLQVMARDPWILEVCLKRMMQSLEIADTLGARKVVFHTGYVHHPHPNHKNTFIEKHLNYWPRLLKKAEEYNLEILLENTNEPDASYIAQVLYEINSPHLNGCLDTGHTHCFTDSRIPLDEWVNGIGKRLTYIHLHANHGVLDEHIAFTDGNQDFSKFFPALEALPEYPQIIIEVKSREAFERSVLGLREIGLMNGQD